MSYTKFKKSNNYNSYGNPKTRSSYSRAPATRSRQPKKEYIHSSRFIKGAKPVNEVEYTPMHSFGDFKVSELIHRNLETLGFTKPSPIQDETVPVGLTGKDVVGIADTGTGKTAAFAIPVLDQLINQRDKFAIILAPTRELAQQIEEQCRSIAKGSGIKGAILIGGVAMGPQLRDLRANPQIVIGTPGRIKDHCEQGTLNLSKFNVVVLDEVDRMLDMGFINDITHILSKTSANKQSFFFSATLDSKVKTIIDGFSNDPVHVVAKTGDTSDNVEQNIITYGGSHEKLEKLHDLLIQKEVVKALVFDDTHRSVERLSKELQLRGFETDAIHGGKSQSQRQRALKRFKDNQVNVLVATDVAARGIDVADISHVINFSQPQSFGDYIHRVGRAGRAGKLGYALTFVQK